MPEILLVDNDKQSTADVVLALKSFQQEFPLQIVKDGNAALNLLNSEKEIDHSKLPRIVLINLDVGRKHAIDFVENVGLIPGLPPITTYILTNERDPEILRLVYKHHVAGYILKPLDSQELQRMIITMLRYWQICEF